MEGENMESHLIIIKNDENRMLCACSNCKQYIASPSNGNGYDYCYHCGAKFDEFVSARRIKELKENAKYGKREN